MVYLTRNDSISILPLSVRLYNGLQRVGIHTIGAILDFSQKHAWADIPALGEKSIQEIAEWVDVFHGSSEEYNLVSEDERLQLLKNAELAELLQYIPIRELDLSFPAKNRLLGAGLLNLSQVAQLNQSELCSIQYMGKKYAQEVVDFCSHLKEEPFVNELLSAHIHLEESHHVSSQPMNIGEPDEGRQLVDELNAFLGMREKYYQKTLLGIREEHPDARGESIVYLLYEDSDIHNKAKDAVLQIIEKNENGISKERLDELMPEHIRNTTICDEILLELERNHSISIVDDEIRRVYPSVLQCLDVLDDERGKDMLLMRWDGKTLVEIGETYGLTRERVRQVIARQMRIIQKNQKKRTLPVRFSEDQYAYLFEKYIIPMDDFLAVFNESALTYHYLSTVTEATNNTKQTLDLSLSDEKIPVEMRRQLERIVYKQYITIDSVRVKKDRPSLVQHFIRYNCKNETKYDAFLQLYAEWLNEIGLSTEDYAIDARSYENRLQQADYVLWGQWRRFRYYSIPSKDYDALIACVDIDQYWNTEISTLKLFRENPDIMQEYDVHDEYELHNLLKKIWPEDDHRVKFHKMPTIEVGEADRDEQVLNLLLQYAPIPAEELARKYEETYGARASTVQGSFFQNFSEYFYNGVYSIDAGNLPADQFEKMKETLDRDIYMISDIKRIYQRLFPHSDAEQINPYTLKTLGFNVNAGYVIKKTYQNAAAYFRHVLTDSMVIDLNALDQRFLNLSAFSSELQSLRHKREIIEFSPKQYLNIQRLNACGITAQDLDEYCDYIFKCAGTGAFFTVASLQKEGIQHSLDESGFDEWFYSSVLSEDHERFSYQRIGLNRLFYVGKSKSVFLDFLYDLVGRREKIDIYDLWELLENDYGIHLPKDKLLEVIRETDMYYDAIMEAVYIDYDTYFEEV